MQKSHTLPLTSPRTKRDKSPTPSASSLASIRSRASEKLKKVPLVGRRKKKKKNVVDSSVDLAESKTDVSDVEVTSSEDAPSSTTAGSSIASEKSEQNEYSVDIASKSPKGSKRRLKKLFKGGKMLFRGKNESAPIAVEECGDVRRSNGISKKDGEGSETTSGIGSIAEENEREHELSKGPKVTISGDEDADYDWSVSSTYARVKKMSIAEIRESVYVEELDDEDNFIDQSDVRSIRSSVATPNLGEDEVGTKKFNFVSASIPSTPDPASDDQSSLNFSKKSPSTLKKEILQITKHRKTSEQYNGAIVKNRKTSLQARNLSDKNELLFKILVIGELGTGKTSIIKRYVHQFFSQHYRATIGVDFALKVLSWDDNTTIRLQLWDIAGQERFGNMTRVYYKEAVGAFIVFDVTRVSTFEAVVKWKQDLDSKVQLPDGGSIPCVLLANKCDQPKEGVVNNHNSMDEFCKEHKFLAWFETSAKENINIDDAASCLVAKIIQNDQKRNEEKEIINGKTNPNSSISLGHENIGKDKKTCAC